MNLLAVKLFLAPSMILLVSLAARRWGPVVGGVLAGLPIIAGPVLLVLGLEQGGAFGREAAAGALGGVISLGLFCFSYAWMSIRYPAALSVTLGWFVFVLSTFFLFHLSLQPSIMFTLALGAIGVMLAHFPSAPLLAEIPSISALQIAARMVAACSLVLLISMLATSLGPHLSGLLAPFPIAGTILSVFTHRFQGWAATVTLLRGFTRGLLGMAVFCYTISISEQSIGFGNAVMLALLLTVIAALSAAIATRRLAIRALPS